eukprot:1145119-Pelagomonas_calceolata.AAC.1
MGNHMPSRDPCLLRSSPVAAPPLHTPAPPKIALALGPRGAWPADSGAFGAPAPPPAAAAGLGAA